MAQPDFLRDVAVTTIVNTLTNGVNMGGNWSVRSITRDEVTDRSLIVFNVGLDADNYQYIYVTVEGDQ